jgi:hypothetical protein
MAEFTWKPPEGPAFSELVFSRRVISGLEFSPSLVVWG